MTPSTSVATRSTFIAGLAIGLATAVIITAIDATSGLVSAVPIIFAAVLAAIDHKTARISNRHNLVLATVTIGGFRFTVTSPTHARVHTPAGAELVVTTDVR